MDANSITAENGAIANLTVSTLKIQDQAVTFPSAAQYVGLKKTLKSPTTFETLVTMSVSATAGSKILVEATGMVGHEESNGTVNSTRNILYNAVITAQPPAGAETILLGFTNLRVMNFNNNGLIMRILFTTASTGTYTYRFKIQYYSGTAYYLVTTVPTLSTLELKK